MLTHILYLTEGKSVNFENAIVCSLHFSPEDFETEAKYSEGRLKKRLLKPCAVPSKFPGPKYLSRPAVVPRSSSALSMSRLDRENQAIVDQNETLLSLDEVSTFEELRDKLYRETIPSKIIRIDQDERLEFIHLSNAKSGMINELNSGKFANHMLCFQVLPLLHSVWSFITISALKYFKAR